MKTKNFLLIITVALLGFIVPLRVQAADQVVSDCGDTGGANQLRAKITAAQASGGGTITFTCGPATIILSSQLPLITKTVTINGGNNITVSGGNTTRILFVNTGGNLTLQNLTLTNGLAGNPGGAVYVASSTFNATNVTIKDSTSTDEGGGLYANNATVNLTNVTLQKNHANTNGGGIYNSNSTFVLNNVSFIENTADDNGGGVYNTSSLTISNSTLSGNSAVTGGGIQNEGGTLTLTNVTISGNGSLGGAGISNSQGRGTLVNVTLTDNQGFFGGGGIYQYSTAPSNTLTLLNTLLSKNLADGSDANCQNDVASTTLIASSGFNLSDDTTCTASLNKIGDKNGSQYDPLLGALAENGGSTKTHLPQTSSPAINGGTTTGCPSTDQRNISRPQGSSCDVGAVEVAECGKPAKPILVKPGNNKKAKGPLVFLDWNDANCANVYDVIVKLGSTSGPKAFKQKNTTNSQTQTSALTKGQTYYWRVIAKNANGKSKSDWWKFTVK
jgi:predicted outer membrane repeat protein